MQIKVNGVVHGEQKAYVGSSSAWKHEGWGWGLHGWGYWATFGSLMKAGPLKETKNLIKDKQVALAVFFRFVLK